MKIIITKGIPAAGKSTWAKSFIKNGGGDWKHINKDALRLMLDFEQYSQSREAFINTVYYVLLDTILTNGYNVVMDDTNLNPLHEARTREIAEKYDAEVEVKWFPITLETAIERDKHRAARVGEDVIRRMWALYQEAGGPVPNFSENVE